jgi:predicted AAA+ superfamily ATPase
MYLKRTVYKKLLEWKQSSRRKPLVIQGARQVGKTFLLKQFGNAEFSDFAYFNLERDPAVLKVFEEQLDPYKLIDILSILREKKIEPQKTLIVLDEIQKSSGALNALKYFNEEANDFYIIAAGSLLGVALSNLKSFPVGKVNFLHIYPLTYSEFLQGMDLVELNNYLLNIKKIEPLPVSIHDLLIENLKLYYITGGMPEVVTEYIKTKDFKIVREVQQEILSSYENDFSKYAKPDVTIRIRQAWGTIPMILSKENKKFQYAEITKGARTREYETSIDWLIHSGLVYRVNCIEKVALPLAGYSKKEIFKLYFFDVGLLGAQLGINPKIILNDHILFTEFKGAQAENFVLQEMRAQEIDDVYYWRNAQTAEVDFIISIDANIIPIEVKAGVDRNTRSLREYQKATHAKNLYRLTLRNLKQDDDLCNIPIYLAGEIQRLTM